MNALRGHSNIQGATDMGGLADGMPGYLKVPTPADTDLAAYLKRTTPTASKPGPWDSFNYYSNTPKFFVSMLKAFYGDAATKENGFAYDYFPKVDRDYSWTHIWDDMYNGKVKGMMAFGMNGVMIGPDTNKNINALKKADWLVVGEIYPDETSEFWKAPGITRRRAENHQYHGVPPALRRLCGKRRQHDELRALGDLEICRGPASGRGAARSGHHRADFPARPGPVQERGRQIPRSHSEFELGVRGRGSPLAFASGHGAQRQSARGPEG